jgi:radical SAM superfamily enzyme YgiQ (UPF0313 family)
MQSKSSWGSLYMPLSLSYSAAIVRNEGFSVTLIDCIAEKVLIDGLIKMVNDIGPDIIVFNTAFPSIKGDLATIGSIKTTFPEIQTVCFCLLPTLIKSELLESNSFIDFAICGEPEWVIAKLVQAISNDDDLFSIDGLIFRWRGEIVVNRSQKLSSNNLDDLPFPARDLLNNDSYRYPLDGRKFTLLCIARGCPYHCTFCTAHHYYGKIFRKRNIDNILMEIAECVKIYHIKNFLFWGEAFTIEPSFGLALSQAIIDSKLKIHWSSRIRVDNLTPELLRLMKRSGCTSLSIGIESFDQNVLDNIKKGITVSQIGEAINMIQNEGIICIGHFIIGLPGDTKVTVQNTIKQATKSKLNFAQFYYATPYPGTELYNQALTNNWLTSTDYSALHLSNASMINDSLSIEQIRYFRKKAYFKFYFRFTFLITLLLKFKGLTPLFQKWDFIKWIRNID